MEHIISLLSSIARYSELLRRWEERQDDEIRFELLFAAWCENRGLALDYELRRNPNNQKTIDFGFETDSGRCINIELVRPDLNEGIREHLSGRVLQGYILTSDHPDPNFRTCAQQIKLQWTLLTKSSKFPSASERDLNLIVVDCTNVHGGMFDVHDLGTAMYGYAGNPYFNEFWEGNKLVGMWEQGYGQRGSESFNENISGVIFVPKQKIDILDGSLMAINPLLPASHRRLLFDELKRHESFVNVGVVQ